MGLGVSASLLSQPHSSPHKVRRTRSCSSGAAAAANSTQIDPKCAMEALLSIETSLGMWSKAALEINSDQLKRIGEAMVEFSNKWGRTLVSYVAQALNSFEVDALRQSATPAGATAATTSTRAGDDQQGTTDDDTLAPISEEVVRKAAVALEKVSAVVDKWVALNSFVQSGVKFVHRARQSLAELGIDLGIDFEPTAARMASRSSALADLSNMLQAAPILERDHTTTAYEEALRESLSWSSGASSASSARPPFLHVLVIGAAASASLQKCSACAWAIDEHDHEGLDDYLLFKLPLGKALVSKLNGRTSNVPSDALGQVRGMGFRDLLSLQSAGVIAAESIVGGVEPLAPLLLKTMGSSKLFLNLEAAAESKLTPKPDADGNSPKPAHISATTMAKRCLHVAPMGLRVAPE